MRSLKWAFAGALVLFPAVAAAGNDDALAEAKKQFRAGVNLLDDPEGAKYEEAYHAFKKAYELSHSPAVLGNIGFCAMHLERDGEAIDAYTAYLRDAPEIDDRERQQIQRDLATLGSTVAKVKIVVRRPATPGNPYELLDTRMQTRGPSIENSYVIENGEVALRVRPGRHVFRVKAADADSLPIETNIEPASDTTTEITFPKPRTVTPIVLREPPSRTGPIMLGVVGLAGIGTGVVTGIMARTTRNTIASRCPNDECPSTYDLSSERTRAKTFGTVADASFVAGGALVGGAALWWLLQSRSSPKRNSTMATAMCSPLGCGVTLERGF